LWIFTGLTAVWPEGIINLSGKQFFSSAAALPKIPESLKLNTDGYKSKRQKFG